MAARPGWRQRHGVAAVALALLVTAVCWPATRHFSSRLFGDTGDALQNLWNAWWMGEALSRGVSPMFTDMLWHPHGVSMWLQTFGPANAFATAVLQSVLPGYAGYNLVVLFHLWFACFGGTVLCAHLLDRMRSDGRLAGVPASSTFLCALGGGVAFGLSPYVWTHLHGHLHVISLGPVALFVHALLRAAETPKARWIGAAGFWALATAACGWYALIHAGMLGIGIWLAVALPGRPERLRAAARVGAAGLLAAALCAPLWLPTLAATSRPLEGHHDPVAYSTDLLALFVPTPHQWLSAATASLTGRFTAPFENGAYLGYVATALTVVGAIVLRPRWLLVLVAIGAVSVILSLGPMLHVAGEIHEQVVLPYALLARAAPAFDRLGLPTRLGLPMNLALGAGVACGGAVVARACARRGMPPGRAGALLVGLFALVLLEYAPSRVVVSEVPVPAFLADLAREPESFAVADLSGWTLPLFHQIHHEKPMVGGYTSRRPAALVRELMGDPVLGPLYAAALRNRRLGALPMSGAAARRHLRDAWDLRYVIAPEGRWRPTLEDELGLRAVARSEGMVLYEIGEGARPPGKDGGAAPGRAGSAALRARPPTVPASP